MTPILDGLFESGRIVDLILLVVLAELIALALWRRLRGEMSLADLIGLLAPGAMLFLALRAALTDAPHTITAACLAAAFAFHLYDLARRRKA
jgi:hypothetical protein